MENIKKALLLISRANGGINRFRSEKEVSGNIDAFLPMQPYDLAAMDAWFAKLDEDQLETVCDGEQSEAEALMHDAPAFTQTLLNDWFEQC